MKRTIACSVEDAIERPAPEVRGQYADMAYHASHDVHPGLRFTLTSAHGSDCTYRQETRLLGLRQRDEVENHIESDGTLQSRVVAGTNKGARITARFKPRGASSTQVELTLAIPLRGPKALLAPLIAFAARKKLAETLAQDKRDLEAGNYARYLAELKTPASP